MVRTFTFVLLIARLLRLIELVVNRGVPATNILRIFAYIVPAFLEVTVPMAMLLAIIVAFGRLSADSEMVAFRSSGLSLYQLITPVAIFVTLATIATAAVKLAVPVVPVRRPSMIKPNRSRLPPGVTPANSRKGVRKKARLTAEITPPATAGIASTAGADSDPDSTAEATSPAIAPTKA